VQLHVGDGRQGERATTRALPSALDAHVFSAARLSQLGALRRHPRRCRGALRRAAGAAAAAGEPGAPRVSRTGR
jgi:hypothetical protein